MTLYTSITATPVSIAEDGSSTIELRLNAWEHWIDPDSDSPPNNQWALSSWYGNLHVEGAGADITNVAGTDYYSSSSFSGLVSEDRRSVVIGSAAANPFSVSTDTDDFTIAILTVDLAEVVNADNPLAIWITPITAEQKQSLTDPPLSTTASLGGENRDGDLAPEIGQPQLTLTQLTSLNASHTSVAEGEEGNYGQASYRVNGDHAVSEDLTLQKTADDPEGHLTDEQITIEWQRSEATQGGWGSWEDTGIATGTYSIPVSDEGQRLRAVISYTDAGENEEQVITAAKQVSFVDNGRAGFSIKGPLSRGSELTAQLDSNDPDGQPSIDSTQFTWQRSADGESAWQEIEGASDQSYTITNDDLDQHLRVQVDYTDLEDFEETVYANSGHIDRPDTGDAIYEIQAPASVEINNLITASQSTADPDGGSQAETIQYTWEREITSGNWEELSNNLGNNYRIAGSSEQESIRVTVSYRDDFDNEESVSSEPYTVPYLDHGDATYNLTGSGTIDGTPLSVTLDAEDPDGAASDVEYSWQRSNDGSNWNDLNNNNQTYQVTVDDFGKHLRALVDYTDAEGHSESVISTSQEIERPNSGTSSYSLTGITNIELGSTIGTELTSADPDGQTSAVSYQWQVQESSEDWVDISGATTETLTLTGSQEDQPLRARISYTDDYGNESVAISDSIDIPLLNNGAASYVIEGTKTAGESLVVTQTTLDPDGEPTESSEISFTWERRDSGGEWNDLGITDTTYELEASDRGKQLRAVIKYQDLQGFEETIYASTQIPEDNDGSAEFSLELNSDQAIIGSSIVATQATKDPDNLTATAEEDLSWKWQYLANDIWNNIQLDNASSIYRLDGSYENTEIRAQVSYSDEKENPEVVNSSSVSIGALDNGVSTYEITGNRVLDAELTASLEVDDPDGEPNDSSDIEISWERSTNGSDSWVSIDHSDEAYTVTREDFDQHLRAKLSYEDGQGFSNTAITDAVLVDRPNTGQAIYSLELGSDLASFSHIINPAQAEADPDGEPNDSWDEISWFQKTEQGDWQSIINSPLANNFNFILSNSDEGNTFKAQIHYKDSFGNEEDVYSDELAIPELNSGQADYNLEYTERGIGDFLSLKDPIAEDPDGHPDSDTISYQWQRSNTPFIDDSWEDIGDNTDTHTIARADINAYLRANLSYIDDQGFTELVQTDFIEIPRVNSGTSSYSLVIPDRLIGSELDVLRDENSLDPDGLPDDATQTYQWQTSDDGTNWVDIFDANDPTFLIGSQYEDKYIGLVIEYVDNLGNEESIEIRDTEIIPIQDSGDASYTLTGSGTIDGTPLEVTLDSNDPDGAGESEVNYSWWRSDDGINNWSEIDSSEKTYSVTIDDFGKHLRSSVEYTDAEGHEESIFSSTREIERPNSGEAGYVLTETSDLGIGSTINSSLEADDPDGQPLDVAYQWQVQESNLEWINITDESNSSLELNGDNEDQPLRLSITYTDDYGNESEVFSNSVNIPPLDNGDASYVIEGIKTVGKSLEVTQTTLDPDGDPTEANDITFKWEQRESEGSWDDLGITDATYTLSNSDRGKELRVLIEYQDLQGFEESIYTPIVLIPEENDGSAEFSLELDSDGAIIGSSIIATQATIDPDNETATAEEDLSWKWQYLKNEIWTSIPQSDLSSIYILDGSYEDTQIRAQISYTDAKQNLEVVNTSSVTIGAIDSGESTYRIDGDRVLDGELTVTLQQEDPDGEPNDSSDIEISWERSPNGSDWTSLDITDESYQATADDSGQQIRAKVSYQDAQGFSNTTFTDVAKMPWNTGKATYSLDILDQPPFNHSVTATQIFSDPDGQELYAQTEAFSWLEKDGEDWTIISGSPSTNTYELQNSDEANYLRAEIIYRDDEDNLETVYTDKLLIPERNSGKADWAFEYTERGIGDSITLDLVAKDPDGPTTDLVIGTNLIIGSETVISEGTSAENAAVAQKQSYTLDGYAAGDVLSIQLDDNTTVNYTVEGTEEDLAGAIASAIGIVNYKIQVDSEEIDNAVIFSSEESDVLTLTGWADADTHIPFSAALSATAPVTAQWQRSYNPSDDNSWENIGDNTDTHTIVGADINAYLRANLSYVDDQDFSEDVTTGPIEIPSLNTGQSIYKLNPLDRKIGSEFTVVDGDEETDLLDPTELDPDGLPDNLSAEYQWLASDDGSSWVDIPNAIDSSLLITSEYEDQYIGVRIEYVDSLRNEESIVISDTDVIPIQDSGDAVFEIQASDDIESTLSIALLNEDPDGSSEDNIIYRWERFQNGEWSDLDYSEGSYIFGNQDVGQQFRALAQYTDGEDHEESVYTDTYIISLDKLDQGTAFYTIDTELTNDAEELIGKFITPELEISDPNGDAIEGSLTFTWQRLNDAGEWLDTDQNEESYQISLSDFGTEIRAEVNYTDGDAFDSTFTTGSLEIPRPNEGEATYQISLPELISVDSQISLSRNESDPDGHPNEEVIIWEYLGANDEWQSLTDSSSETYSITSEDNTKQIRARVSYIDDLGNQEEVLSSDKRIIFNEGSAVYAIDESNPIGSASSPFINQELTVNLVDLDPDGQSNLSYSIEWQRQEITDAESTWSEVSSSNKYLISLDDHSHSIQAVISYVDDLGFRETVETAPLDVIFTNDGSSQYELSGVGVIGFPLEPSLLISDPDGFNPESIQHHWQVRDGQGSWSSVEDQPADNIYIPGDDFLGKQIRLMSSYTDFEGFDETEVFSAITELESPSQSFNFNQSDLYYQPGNQISVPINWEANTNQLDLRDLSLQIHYNSDLLTYRGANSLGGQSGLEVDISDDLGNQDNDLTTDKLLTLSWPQAGAPTKQGAGQDLLKLNFDTSSQEFIDPINGGDRISTPLNLLGTPSSGYSLTSSNDLLLQARSFNLDVDGDGKVEALTDGLMIIRKLFGDAFAGTALTNNAQAGDHRTTEEIHAFIQQGIDSKFLDVDNDGDVQALTDGLMIIRRLFGDAFTGSALTDAAISSSSGMLPTDTAGNPLDYKAITGSQRSLVAEAVAGAIDALNPEANG